MSKDDDTGNSCCAKPIRGLYKLNFFDGTQANVVGLGEIFAAIYAEGRQVNDETVEEIIDRLEAKKNFIPSSDRARREYSYVLMKEYRAYIKSRADNSRE
jgi:hypothetical protein